MKNVILLTIDALRKDALGCYGNQEGLTPFMDSLLQESIIFTRAQSVGPYTQASFPGILTSSYYCEYGGGDQLAPERVLISEALKEHNVRTAGFHSNPYCSEMFGWNRGWDHFYDSMEDETEPNIPYIRGFAINEKVDDWLASVCEGGKPTPFFLWLHFMDVHEPYLPTEKYMKIANGSLSLSREEMLDLFKNVLLERDVSDPAKVELLRKLYNCHVREVDDYVHRFLLNLEKHDLLQDTVVILTSDHGDEFGEHGSLSHNDQLYSELIDVPLIIYGNVENKGKRCDTVVSSVDIAPTILHLFGLNPIEKFEGRSLMPLSDYADKGCYGEAVHHKRGVGKDMNKDVYFYREGDLKIIHRANLDSWEMYDLKTDPKELTNIVDSSPKAEELKNKLKPRVRRWLK